MLPTVSFIVLSIQDPVECCLAGAIWTGAPTFLGVLCPCPQHHGQWLVQKHSLLIVCCFLAKIDPRQQRNVVCDMCPGLPHRNLISHPQQTDTSSRRPGDPALDIYALHASCELYSPATAGRLIQSLVSNCCYFSDPPTFVPQFLQ